MGPNLLSNNLSAASIAAFEELKNFIFSKFLKVIEPKATNYHWHSHIGKLARLNTVVNL